MSKFEPGDIVRIAGVPKDYYGEVERINKDNLVRVLNHYGNKTYETMCLPERLTKVTLEEASKQFGNAKLHYHKGSRPKKSSGMTATKTFNSGDIVFYTNDLCEIESRYRGKYARVVERKKYDCYVMEFIIEDQSYFIDLSSQYMRLATIDDMDKIQLQTAYYPDRTFIENTYGKFVHKRVNFRKRAEHVYYDVHSGDLVRYSGNTECFGRMEGIVSRKGVFDKDKVPHVEVVWSGQNALKSAIPCCDLTLVAKNTKPAVAPSKGDYGLFGSKVPLITDLIKE